MTTPPAASSAVAVVVNGPEDDPLDWSAIDWQTVEEGVRRLRQRIFTASQAGGPQTGPQPASQVCLRAFKGLLEPDARKRARPVLRGAGRSNAPGLPGEGRALRTETTINDPRDFGLSKRLTNLAALRQIGFTANRRLLGVQRISHDPIRGAQAFTDLTSPIITNTGTRIPALRFGNARVHALLQALLIHRLLPNGFTNRDLRALVATLLGTTIEDISAGKMTYDLRRLRVHGLIARIPKSRRYQVTDAGLQDALLFTHAHDHLLRTALAQLVDPAPPRPSQLRTATHAYQAAFDKLASQAHLAA